MKLNICMNKNMSVSKKSFVINDEISHIQYYKMKMKINLAAQTLSQSVADTLEFCMNYLKLPDFQGCEATIRFIRSYSQGYKAPLKRENEYGCRS